MTSLIKFCKPEHNIVERCRTLRLGTLEYYRTLDPKFLIADENEGIESTIIRNMNTSTASPDALAATSPIAAMPQVHFANIRLQTNFPNCYIWCCSRCSEPTLQEGAKFDDEYNSWYRVPRPDRFAEHLHSLMMWHVTRQCFSDAARDLIDSLPVAEMGLSLTIFHHDVVYVDQKTQSIDGGRLNPYVLEIPQALRPIFVKPTKYANDREYRFVCLFEHKRFGLLSVRREPLDLPLFPAE